MCGKNKMTAILDSGCEISVFGTDMIPSEFLTVKGRVNLVSAFGEKLVADLVVIPVKMVGSSDESAVALTCAVTGKLARGVQALLNSEDWDMIKSTSTLIQDKTKSRELALYAVCEDSTSAPPPSVNAGEKPIAQSLRTQPQSHGQGSSVMNGANGSVSNSSSSAETTSSEVQPLSMPSKPNSFDRGNQHDSGIDVSDQPSSTTFLQRSSPSNDCKSMTPKVSTSSSGSSGESSCLELEITGTGNIILTSVGNPLTDKEATDVEKSKSIQLPVSLPVKEHFSKGEDGTDMKLDFTFDSELAQLTGEKGGNTVKQIGMSHSMQVSSAAATVGVHTPVSPSTDELNLKIASVKKVWESVPPMPTDLEHATSGSNVTTEDSGHSPQTSSFSTYAGNVKTSGMSNTGTVDTSVQTRGENRSSPPLQQSGQVNMPSPLNLKPAIVAESQDVCKVKPQQVQQPHHNQTSGSSIGPSPISPPVGSIETNMANMRNIANLANSVQVASLQAIPCPPTMLFSSNQQMAQTGIYQPLQQYDLQIVHRRGPQLINADFLSRLGGNSDDYTDTVYRDKGWQVEGLQERRNREATGLARGRMILSVSFGMRPKIILPPTRKRIVFILTFRATRDEGYYVASLIDFCGSTLSCLYKCICICNNFHLTCKTRVLRYVNVQRT